MPQNPVIKGSVVKYHDGWYRVSRKTTTSVNLMGIFHGTVLLKRVPLKDVQEDEEEWTKHWQQSETYRSM